MEITIPLTNESILSEFTDLLSSTKPTTMPAFLLVFSVFIRAAHTESEITAVIPLKLPIPFTMPIIPPMAFSPDTVPRIFTFLNWTLFSAAPLSFATAPAAATASAEETVSTFANDLMFSATSALSAPVISPTTPEATDVDIIVVAEST